MAQDRGGDRNKNYGGAAESFVPNKGGGVTAPANAPLPKWGGSVLASAPPPYRPQSPSYGIGTPTGGGMGGSPAPAPQTRPVMSKGDWLSGDSTYQNQMSEYGSSLNDFLSRLTTQQNDFQADYDVSKQGLARNQASGMQALGEDFTSRGMANSGLFDKAGQEAEANYGRQGSALDTARTRALSDFGNQRKDKEASTEKAKQNARSASLGRMASDQMFA